MNGYEATLRKEAQNQATINRTTGLPAPQGPGAVPRQPTAIDEIAGRLNGLIENAAILQHRIGSAIERAAGPTPATAGECGSPCDVAEAGLHGIGRRLTEMEQRMTVLFCLAERLELIA